MVSMVYILSLNGLFPPPFYPSLFFSFVPHVLHVSMTFITTVLLQHREQVKEWGPPPEHSLPYTIPPLDICCSLQPALPETYYVPDMLGRETTKMNNSWPHQSLDSSQSKRSDRQSDRLCGAVKVWLDWSYFFQRLYEKILSTSHDHHSWFQQ